MYLEDPRLVELQVVHHIVGLAPLVGDPVSLPYLLVGEIFMRDLRRQIEPVSRAYPVLPSVHAERTAASHAVDYLMIGISVFADKMKFGIACADAEDIKRKIDLIVKHGIVEICHKDAASQHL